MFAPAAEPQVIAHRGASAYETEHTFASYDRAVAIGAGMIELDLRPTRDGVPVVVHDRTLRRVHGDSRRVGAVDFEELARLDRPVLRLENVLDRYGSSTRYLIELKEAGSIEAVVIEALRARGLEGCAEIQSFSRAALDRAAACEPGVPLARLIRPTATRAQVLEAILAAPGFVRAIGPWAGVTDRAVVRAAHRRGLLVRPWTVNDPSEMRRLLRAGVDGLITDLPDVALEVVAGRAARSAA